MTMRAARVRLCDQVSLLFHCKLVLYCTEWAQMAVLYTHTHLKDVQVGLVTTESSGRSDATGNNNGQL